jgi:excisionase family DNA binding protein
MPMPTTNSKALKQVNAGDFLTVEEAARVLGIQSNAIRNYLCADKFTTYKFKSLTLIRTDEVEKWKVRRRKRK